MTTHGRKLYSSEIRPGGECMGINGMVVVDEIYAIF